MGKSDKKESDNLHVKMFIHMPKYAVYLLFVLKFFGMKKTARKLVGRYVDIN